MQRFFILLLILTTKAFAETLYYNQAGAGSADGSSLANAWSASQASDAANWGVGAGKISAGDTLVVNGTITTQLVIQGDGTNGSPITLQFASGASFSKAYWGETTASAIYATGKSYITIDGNSVGIMENTNNGDGGSMNHQFTCMIYATGGSNWIVKNLTIRTVYVHTFGTANNPGSNTLPYHANGVQLVNCPSSEVTNCNISDCYTGVLYQQTTATSHVGPNVHHNTFAACSTAEFIGTTGSGQTMTVNYFDYNDVTMGLNWYEVADENHIDGYHSATGTVANYGVMTAVYVRGNYIHGNPSTNCSGYIYISDTVTDGYIQNNLLVGATNKPANGYTYTALVGTGDVYYENNTTVGIATDNTGGNGIDIESNNPTGTTTWHIKDNIWSTLYVGIYHPSSTVSWDINYNDYYNVGSYGADGGGFYGTLAAWKVVTGGDANSITTNPNLDGSYNISNTSPCYNTGTSTAADGVTTDRVGTSRPQSTAYDIGSMEVIVSGGAGGSTMAGKITMLGVATIK